MNFKCFRRLDMSRHASAGLHYRLREHVQEKKDSGIKTAEKGRNYIRCSFHCLIQKRYEFHSR